MIGHDRSTAISRAAAAGPALARACDDLSRRLRAGQDCSAEDLLAEEPELLSDADAALELIYTEFVVREQLGHAPQAEEWLDRFPQWRGELEQIFEVHKLVAGVATHASLQSDTEHSRPHSPTSIDQSVTSLARGAAIGGYELLEEIGRGGMGVVYKARQRGLSRLVAVKMILPPHAPRALVRFRTEAEATARLSHPGIVQVFEVGQKDDLPFLSMELVAGRSLDKQLAESPLAPAAAAKLLLALAEAVAYAHDQGIIHRDLKPANILIAEGGAAKITDFGLARILSESGASDEPRADATQSGAILGTPSYMAPEQSHGRRHEIGPASDVYSLGAILYETLTGRPPFRGQSPLDTLELVRTQEPVPPRRLVPKVPRDLETICLKCLAKEPGSRYRSAAELAADLRRFLAGEPISARRTGPLERAWRWCRRRPVTAALVAALALALVVGPAGVVWQRGVATAALREKQLAEKAKIASEKYSEALSAARLVAVAHREWLADHGDEARRLLDQCPPEHRTSEWQHLNALSHAKLLTLKGRQPGSYHVFFSPTGGLFGVANVARPVGIDVYDGRTGESRFHVPATRRVECAAFQSDDKLLTLVTNNVNVNERSVRIIEDWDLATQVERRQIVFERGTRNRPTFYQSVISVDGETLAWVAPGVESRPSEGSSIPREVVAWGRKIVVWNIADSSVQATINAAPRAVSALAMTHDGRRLAAAQSPDVLLVLDPRTGAEVASIHTGTPSLANLAISGDGRLVACTTGDKHQSDGVTVWNVSENKEVARIEPPYRVQRMELSHDGRFLALGCGDTSVQLWRVPDGQHIASLRAHRIPVMCVALSPSAHRLVSADSESIVLWDISPWTSGALASAIPFSAGKAGGVGPPKATTD